MATVKAQAPVHPIPIPHGWLKTGDAAKHLGVSIRYLRRIHQEWHRLHPRNFGGVMLLWEVEELDAYKATHPRLGQRRRQEQAA